MFRLGAVISQKYSAFNAVKTALQDVANDTLTDVATVQVSIGANETWIFEWVFGATFSAAGQIKVAVVTPAGATLLVQARMTPQGIVPAYSTTTTSGTECALSCATAVAGLVRIVATVINGATPGIVKMQFAQNTADAAATRMLAGAALSARKC